MNTKARLQEPDKTKTKKALPIPEEKKRAKRGGKRVRKFKERFAMTEIRKAQNRLSTTAEDEYGDSAMGLDVGINSSDVNHHHMNLSHQYLRCCIFYTFTFEVV